MVRAVTASPAAQQSLYSTLHCTIYSALHSAPLWRPLLAEQGRPREVHLALEPATKTTNPLRRLPQTQCAKMVSTSSQMSIQVNTVSHQHQHWRELLPAYVPPTTTWCNHLTLCFFQSHHQVCILETPANVKVARQ